MAHRHTNGIPSTAAISGHPLHPMLVPFPIAYLVGALVSDFAYLGTGDVFWANTSLWLIAAGLVMGVLAAMMGLTDFLTKREIRNHSIAWAHFFGNAVVLALALVNLLIRVGNPEEGVQPAGWILSLVVAGVLVYTGWLGGELAYRHKIGVIGAEEQPQSEHRISGTERRTGPADRRIHA